MRRSRAGLLPEQHWGVQAAMDNPAFARTNRPRVADLEEHGAEVGQQDDDEQREAVGGATCHVGGPVAGVHVAHADQEAQAHEGKQVLVPAARGGCSEGCPGHQAVARQCCERARALQIAEVVAEVAGQSLSMLGPITSTCSNL